MKKNNWVIFVINGLIAIILGLLFLSADQGRLQFLMRIIGLVLVAGGAVMFYSAFKSMKAKKSNFLLLFEAVLALLAGAVIAISPGKFMNLFLILLGVWAVVLGLLQIISAVQMRKKMSHHYLFTLNGIITLVFGILLFYNPIGTTKGLLMVTGFLTLLAGVLMIYLGIKVKRI
jgi:uncharacterized membrane protein HdeD (DUF308 family)